MPSFLPPLIVVLVPLVGNSMMHLFLPVVAPLLMEATGREPTTYGWVAGAVGLGSVWFYMSNKNITPALGPILTLKAGIGFMLVGAAMMATAIFPLVLIGGFLVGFGYATSTPAGSQILADHAPKQYWATLFSLRQSGVPFGGMLAGSIGSWLISHQGWRTAFICIALISTACATILFFAPRSYNESRPRTKFRLAGLFALSNFKSPFRALQMSPGLSRLAVACVGFAMMQSAVFSFFVIYLHAGLGYSLVLAGGLFAILQGASVVGRIFFGFAADRIEAPRAVLMTLAASSSVSALTLAALTPDLSPLALTAIALFIGSSVSTWNGLYLAEAARLAPLEALRYQ